jgi:ATP-dependent protease Clp ATPase subunit
MRDVMFDLPSRKDVREVVVTGDCVEADASPLLVLHPEEPRKMEA